MIPENQELVNEIESILLEDIPDNLIDKIEMHKNLQTVLDKAFQYNNYYIDPIIRDAKNTFDRTGICKKIKITLNPSIQAAIENAMQRCIEIYHSLNVDR